MKCDKTLKRILRKSHEEAFIMLKEAQSEVTIERNKSFIFQLIAKMASATTMDCLKHLHPQIREMIHEMSQCAENMGVPNTKAYATNITKRARNDLVRTTEMEDDLRPEYNFKELKKAPPRSERQMNAFPPAGLNMTSYWGYSQGGMPGTGLDAGILHPVVTKNIANEGNNGEKERVDV